MGWSRDPEVDPHKHRCKGSTVEKRLPFSTWGWNHWTFTCKKMNADTDLTSFTKINSRRIIDLNVKCRTIKLLEDNLGETLETLVIAMIF